MTGPQTPGALSKGKAPLELAYEPPNFEPRASVPQAALKSRQRPPLPPSGGELVLMALDVMEDSPQAGHMCCCLRRCCLSTIYSTDPLGGTSKGFSNTEHHTLSFSRQPSGQAKLSYTQRSAC